MIKLLCVGKESMWDFVSKQTGYAVKFTKYVSGSEFWMPMEKEEFDSFEPGIWYEFIATELPTDGT